MLRLIKLAEPQGSQPTGGDDGGMDREVGSAEREMDGGEYFGGGRKDND